jgi:hypothetical protein
MPILSSITKSTEATEIPKKHWPSWSNGSAQFNRMVVYSAPDNHDIQTSLSSTPLIALLTERIDTKDYPSMYNYNIYLIAETTDGKLYQSHPIKPKDPAHHSSKPSTWFDDLGSPCGLSPVDST